MQQYLIHAYDGNDEAALARRMAVRPNHFDYIRTIKEAGNFIMGGAILDETGKMIGSNVVLQFESDTDFDNYFKNEPYVKGDVWQNITIHKFKLANV